MNKKGKQNMQKVCGQHVLEMYIDKKKKKQFTKHNTKHDDKFSITKNKTKMTDKQI